MNAFVRPPKNQPPTVPSDWDQVKAYCKRNGINLTWEDQGVIHLFGAQPDGGSWSAQLDLQAGEMIEKRNCKLIDRRFSWSVLDWVTEVVEEGRDGWVQ